MSHMLTTQRTVTGRGGARERVVRQAFHLAARRQAQERAVVERVARRAQATTYLAEEPGFWRATTPEQREGVRRQLNADRAILGLDPVEELADPRFGALTAAFHRHCLEVQRGVPVDEQGEPRLEPYVEELAQLFGEEFLVEQNVEVHNRMLVGGQEREEGGKEPRSGVKGTAGGDEEGEEEERREPPRALKSWRENYRELLRPYAVAAPTVEARRERFGESLETWRELRRDPETRPELAARFAASRLRESQALGLGWTAQALEAYAQQETPGSTAARVVQAQLALAYLSRVRAHLEVLLDPQTPEEVRREEAARLLEVLFGVDPATAERVGELPPRLQWEVLRGQGVLRPGDTRSKAAWERMVFARVLPRRAAGLSAEARAEYVRATRELARGTWRYFTARGASR